MFPISAQAASSCSEIGSSLLSFCAAAIAILAFTADVWAGELLDAVRAGDVPEAAVAYPAKSTATIADVAAIKISLMR